MVLESGQDERDVECTSIHNMCPNSINNNSSKAITNAPSYEKKKTIQLSTVLSNITFFWTILGTNVYPLTKKLDVKVSTMHIMLAHHIRRVY